MRALSVFPGGFTADAARHLLGANVLPVLEQLADQSLLKVTDTASGTRYRMLETVREFAAARWEDAGETERVTGRFLAWARDFGVGPPRLRCLTSDDSRPSSWSGPSRTTWSWRCGTGSTARMPERSPRCRPCWAGCGWSSRVSPGCRALAAGHGPGPAAVPAGGRPRRGHPDQPGPRRGERVPAAGAEPGAVPGGPAAAAARSAGHLRPGRPGRAERAGRVARGGPRDPGRRWPTVTSRCSRAWPSGGQLRLGGGGRPGRRAGGGAAGARRVRAPGQRLAPGGRACPDRRAVPAGGRARFGRRGAASPERGAGGGRGVRGVVQREPGARGHRGGQPAARRLSTRRSAS